MCSSLSTTYAGMQLTILHCDNHLDTLGVDLLALLVPVDHRLGIASGLAHKWCHTPRHSNLVCGNLVELGGSWETARGGEKDGEDKDIKKMEHRHENWSPFIRGLTPQAATTPRWTHAPFDCQWPDRLTGALMAACVVLTSCVSSRGHAEGLPVGHK